MNRIEGGQAANDYTLARNTTDEDQGQMEHPEFGKSISEHLYLKEYKQSQVIGESTDGRDLTVNLTSSEYRIPHPDGSMIVVVRVNEFLEPPLAGELTKGHDRWEVLQQTNKPDGSSMARSLFSGDSAQKVYDLISQKKDARLPEYLMLVRNFENIEEQMRALQKDAEQDFRTETGMPVFND
jgi:hypothetical protein